MEPVFPLELVFTAIPRALSFVLWLSVFMISIIALPLLPIAPEKLGVPGHALWLTEKISGEKPSGTGCQWPGANCGGAHFVPAMQRFVPRGFSFGGGRRKVGAG